MAERPDGRIWMINFWENDIDHVEENVIEWLLNTKNGSATVVNTETHETKKYHS